MFIASKNKCIYNGRRHGIYKEHENTFLGIHVSEYIITF